MGAIRDHFEGEDVIITIEEEGADTVTNVEGKISNIDIGGGNTPTEDVFLFGSKTINFQKPREKYTVAFDYITSTTTFAQIQFGTTSGSTPGTENRSSDSSKRYRIILWFQDSSLHAANSSDASIVVPTKVGRMRRMIFCDCKAVENKVTAAADDMLRGTINFEFAATDSDGYANYYDEWVKGTTTTTLTTLTTRHKGTLSWIATAATAAWKGSYRT